MVRENLALGVVRDVDVAEVLAPAVRGDDEDLVAVLVGLERRVRALGALDVAEQRVRVPAHDELQARCLAREPLVLVVPDVGDGRDARDVGRAPDLVDRSLHRGHHVRELGALARAADAGDRLGRRADDGQAVLLEDVVGLDRGWGAFALVSAILTYLSEKKYRYKSQGVAHSSASRCPSGRSLTRWGTSGF